MYKDALINRAVGFGVVGLWLLASLAIAWRTVRRQPEPPPFPTPTPFPNHDVRHWPAKVSTSIGSRVKVMADIGAGPQEGYGGNRWRRAAFFTLCSLVKKYPRKSGTLRFEVAWVISADDISPAEAALEYDRTSNTLTDSTTLLNRHGVQYTRVTDLRLLQLEKRAGRDGFIKLDDLLALGCTREYF